MNIPDIVSSECDPIRLENQNLNCLLYTDDLLLLLESSRGLQKCLDHLYFPTKKCKLNINTKKLFNKSGIVPLAKTKFQWPLHTHI